MVVKFIELNDEGDLLANDRYQLTFGQVPGVGDARSLSVLCDHVGLPVQSVGHVRVKLLGFTAGFAGNESSENVLNASFYEAVDGRVLRALTTWRLFIRDRVTHTGPLRSEYAITASLKIFDTTGRTTFEFALVNLFPISIQPTDVAESSGPAKHEVQFNVDEVRLLNVGAPTGSQTGRSTTLNRASNTSGVRRDPAGNGIAQLDLVNQGMGLLQFAKQFLR